MQTALHQLLNLWFLCKLKGINVKIILASFVSLSLGSACCFGLTNEGAAFRRKDRFNFAVSKPEIARLKSDPLKSAEQSNVPAIYLDLLKILSVDKRIWGLAIAVLFPGCFGKDAWLYSVWNFCSSLALENEFKKIFHRS